MSESQIIQVRMKEQTIGQIDKLKTIVNAPSRSDAVRRAVDITDILLTAILKGEKIIVEKKNGKQTEILITGLNR